jgi:hypothetical protein
MGLEIISPALTRIVASPCRSIALGLTQPPTQREPGAELKRPGTEADHSTATNA